MSRDTPPGAWQSDEYDRVAEQRKQDNWIKHHGARFQPFPEVFCLSWHWPKWWGPPEVFTRPDYSPNPTIPTDAAARAEALRIRQTFHKNGLPVRLLKFHSGNEVWQLLTPVHGFDEPGATLPDPRDTHRFPD